MIDPHVAGTVARPIEWGETDFVPLASFSLGWRFAPDRVGTVPADVIARIRPVTAARAAEFAGRSSERREDAAQAGISFRSDDSPGVVRELLRALPPTSGTEVIISWDARTALVSDWETFVAHWDDFCYPSSDDVTVCPFDGSWMLCYRHFEVFQFKTRPNGRVVESVGAPVDL